MLTTRPTPTLAMFLCPQNVVSHNCRDDKTGLVHWMKPTLAMFTPASERLLVQLSRWQNGTRALDETNSRDVLARLRTWTRTTLALAKWDARMD